MFPCGHAIRASRHFGTVFLTFTPPPPPHTHTLRGSPSASLSNYQLIPSGIGLVIGLTTVLVPHTTLATWVWLSHPGYTSITRPNGQRPLGESG